MYKCQYKLHFFSKRARWKFLFLRFFINPHWVLGWSDSHSPGSFQVPPKYISGSLWLFYRLQPLMVVDFDDDAQNRFIELTESRFSWQLLFRWISKSFILKIDAFISLFTSQNATVIHCAPPRYRPKLKLILHCKPKFSTLTHSMGNDKILPILLTLHFNEF